MPADADTLSDLIVEGALRFELSATAGELVIKGDIELFHDDTLDVWLHGWYDC